VFGSLGSPWLAWGRNFSSALLHRTVLKAPSDQALEERPDRPFLASHPRLRTNRQRRIPVEPPRGDGASSLGTAKTQQDEFGHRAPNFAALYRGGSLTAKFKSPISPHFELIHPFRSSDMAGSSSSAWSARLVAATLVVAEATYRKLSSSYSVSITPVVVRLCKP
jgi:hypothetical protein